METKILLRLLKDDIKILESISDSFINQTILTPEEVEVALVRARAVVMEFEMLSKNLSREEELQPGSDVNPDPGEKTEKKARSLRNFLPFIKSEEVNSPGQNPAKVDNGNDSGQNDTSNLQESHLNKTSGVITSIPLTQEIPKKEEPGGDSTALIEIAEEIVGSTENTGGEKPEVVNEEVIKLLSGENNESKFGIIPLKNLREGIGLNDRFLFIRELFQNNEEKFNQTISTLDEFTSIEEAVKYLKQNFKWNKSETGEKFLLLIKRRFAK